jgi:hypothetical protein
MPKLVSLFAMLVLAIAPLGARAQDDIPTEEGAEASHSAEAAPAPAGEAPASQPAAPASQPAAPVSAAASEASPTDDDDDDVGPPIEASFPGAALQGRSGDPTVGQRRLIAYLSSGVAVAALATGVTFGILANNEYGCLADVLACNQTRDEPILGSAFLDKKAEVDTLSLFADMAYVVAVAATIVAVTGYIRGYWLTGEEEVSP